MILLGKTKIDFVKLGMDEYLKRLRRYAKCQIIEINDLKNTKSLSPQEIKKRETQLFEKQIKNESYWILDENGRSFSSIQFASFIEKEMVSRPGNLNFLVGGAYGFSDDMKKKASGSISLSSLTYSHQLVRIVFLEQLYRAFSILNGDPYHNA